MGFDGFPETKDEATSALDPATEGKFFVTLEHIAKERTVIVFTHCMAHALRADLMFVMHKEYLARC